MKHHIIRYILALMPALAVSMGLQAQPASLLDSIEHNNATLRALRAKLDADVLANNQNLSLPNPDAEVDYMLGSPKGVPNRTNVSVSQSLDWGVLTGRRRALARASDEKAAAAYRAERQQILTEAAKQLVNAVYCNRLCAELTRRKALADTVQSLYEKKFQAGDAGQLELNKVRLNATLAQADLSRAQAERETVELALQNLNGGRPLPLVDTAYTMAALPSPALWRGEGVASQPLVQQSRAAVSEAEQSVRLAKAEALPTFSVGFTGEYISQNNYSGVSLGVSLPLWGNGRRRTKAAQAELLARNVALSEAQTQAMSVLETHYCTALRLRTVADKLNADVAALSNEHLLRRSLDEGRISLIDYMMEQTFLYSAQTAALEAERDAQSAAAVLRVLLESE